MNQNEANILMATVGASAASLILYYLIEQRRNAEAKYQSMRSMKIWSIEELKLEALKNHVNPSFPSVINYEDYGRFSNVLVQGDLWTDPSQRVKGKVQMPMEYDHSSGIVQNIDFFR